MAANSIGNSVIACAIATVLVAAIIVILRLFTRWKILNFVGREDWFILAALFFSVANTTGMCFQATYALGHHIDTLSSDEITNFLKAFYFTVLSYNISQTLAKISILLLYLRLFSVSNIRKACYTLLAIVILYGLWLFFTAILVCVPAAHWWDSAHVSGTCLPEKFVWFFNVSLNILTDVGIVLLPMPVIRTLVLPKRQKLGLYFIFALGFFVCIISFLRIHWLIVAAESTDPTWDNIGIANWSCIELNTAIICPCLTTLKPLLSHCFPHIFSTGNSSNKFYHQYGEGVDAESNIGSSKPRGIIELRKKSKSTPSDSDVEADGRCFEGVSLESLEPVIAHPGKETGTS